jgi:hypothetical protein
VAQVAYSGHAAMSLGLRLNRPCIVKRPAIVGRLPTGSTIDTFVFTAEQSLTLRITIGRSADPALLVVQHNGTAQIAALDASQIDDRVRNATVAKSFKFSDVVHASLERVVALRDKLQLNVTAGNVTEFRIATTAAAGGACRVRVELLEASGFASQASGTQDAKVVAPAEVLGLRNQTISESSFEALFGGLSVNANLTVGFSNSSLGIQLGPLEVDASFANTNIALRLKAA